MTNRYAALGAAILFLLAVSTSSSAQQVQASKPAMDCAAAHTAAADHAMMDHAAHAAEMSKCDTALPSLPGQAAFGAISEVVRILKADPNTDWTRVNIEALRQHLIDMDEVTMRAVVTQRDVPGGAEMEVTGAARTADAIKRMAVNHTKMLDQDPEYHATAQVIQNGARITVTAKNPADAHAVARIRGLGFAGLMTEGNHHAAHHLALARGDSDPHGR